MSPSQMHCAALTVRSEKEFFGVLSAAIGGEISVKETSSRSALGFTMHEYILGIRFNGRSGYGNVVGLEPSNAGDGYFRYRGATKDSDFREIEIRWERAT